MRAGVETTAVKLGKLPFDLIFKITSSFPYGEIQRGCALMENVCFLGGGKEVAVSDCQISEGPSLSTDNSLYFLLPFSNGYMSHLWTFERIFLFLIAKSSYSHFSNRKSFNFIDLLPQKIYPNCNGRRSLIFLIVIKFSVAWGVQVQR